MESGFCRPVLGERAGPIATVGATWQELIPLLTARLASNSESIQLCATVPEAVSYVAEALG